MAALEQDYRTVSNTDLLAEANHRIANHLSLLASMIQMQATALNKGPDMFSRSQVRMMLQEAASKVVGVGNMHRRFAHQVDTEELDLGIHLIECTHQLVSHLSLTQRVSIAQRLGNGCNVTPEQAQTIVLIAGEILMNAVKHAHPAGLPTCISINCARNWDGSIAVEIGDDGVGLPENFNQQTDGGLGFRLIRALCDKINAKLTIESDSLGLSFHLRLPARQN